MGIFSASLGQADLTYLRTYLDYLCFTMLPRVIPLLSHCYPVLSRVIPHNGITRDNTGYNGITRDNTG